MSESSEELNDGREACRRATLRRSKPEPETTLRGGPRWVSYQPRNGGFSELRFQPGRTLRSELGWVERLIASTKGKPLWKLFGMACCFGLHPRRPPLAGCSSWQLEEQSKKDLVGRLMKGLRFPIRAALFYGSIFSCFSAVRKMPLDIPHSNAILALGYPAF